MNRGFYHFCPLCGAYIDPFEVCTCITAEKNRRSKEALENNHRGIDRDNGTIDRSGVEKRSHIFSLSAMS